MNLATEIITTLESVNNRQKTFRDIAEILNDARKNISFMNLDEGLETFPVMFLSNGKEGSTDADFVSIRVGYADPMFETKNIVKDPFIRKFGLRIGDDPKVYQDAGDVHNMLKALEEKGYNIEPDSLIVPLLFSLIKNGYAISDTILEKYAKDNRYAVMGETKHYVYKFLVRNGIVYKIAYRKDQLKDVDIHREMDKFINKSYAHDSNTRCVYVEVNDKDNEVPSGNNLSPLKSKRGSKRKKHPSRYEEMYYGEREIVEYSLGNEKSNLTRIFGDITETFTRIRGTLKNLKAIIVLGGSTNAFERHYSKARYKNEYAGISVAVAYLLICQKIIGIRGAMNMSFPIDGSKIYTTKFEPIMQNAFAQINEFIQKYPKKAEMLPDLLFIREGNAAEEGFSEEYGAGSDYALMFMLLEKAPLLKKKLAKANPDSQEARQNTAKYLKRYDQYDLDSKSFLVITNNPNHTSVRWLKRRHFGRMEKYLHR